MRRLPYTGQRAEVQHFGVTEPARVVAASGASVTVRVVGAEEDLVFDLNALTAHWVLRGEPYWGTRLWLRDGE